MENSPITWTNEKRKLSDFIPWDHNPREINKKEAERLGESLETFGQIQTIAIGPNGELYDGHQRHMVWSILPRLGPDFAVDVRVSSRPLTEKERQKLVIFLHRGTVGQWDWDIMANNFEVPELLEWGFEESDLQLDWGSDEKAEDPGAQVDKAEELQEKWSVELGQLWALGEHRLICGDCTDADVVARVMGGEKADCTVTDPPYGVGVDYESFEDAPENVKTLIALVMPILFEYKPIALTPGVPAMWDYPRPSWVGAWVHPASTSSGPWGFVDANPILYYGKDPYLKARKGRRPASIVLSADRQGIDGHPAPKPLKMWEWLVERMTPSQKLIVLDPFLGSGTTLIACQRLNRKCRAIEIDPGYVAVTIQRWVDMTGGEPVLLGI